MTPTPFTPGTEGTFFDLPDKTYREAPGISNSMLKHVSATGEEPGSPAHFQVYLKDPTRLTRPLLLGRLAHAAILRPDDPLETISIQPKERPLVEGDSALKKKGAGLSVGDMVPWHNGSKFCKEWNAQQEACGNTVVSDKEYETLVGVVKSVAAHPEASRALKEGQAEVSVFSQFWREVDGEKRVILRKARMDWVSKGSAICDVKTTTDSRLEEVSKQIYSRGYYRQADYYLSVWNDQNPDDQKTNFCFIFVEKSPPYAISVVDLNQRAIQLGREENHRDLHILMECEAQGEWPAYPPEIKTIDLPAKAYRTGMGVYQ